MDELALIFISAIINGVFMGIFMYIGLTKGSAKTVDIALDRVEKKMSVSPTAKRLMKFLEKSDEIFGDDKLVENVTRFFKEAGELVSSPEAKNFFKNVADALKELGEESEKPKINLPSKPTVKSEVADK